ncbi:hypothetical protein D3C79_1041260 [compost metagenome]
MVEMQPFLVSPIHVCAELHMVIDFSKQVQLIDVLEVLTQTPIDLSPELATLGIIVDPFRMQKPTHSLPVHIGPGAG